MKTLKKFWGIALVVVLLSSLLVIATPASAADPLIWTAKLDAPSSLFQVLSPTNNILDYAINGATMYAVTANITQGTSYMFQSVLGGAMWTDISAKVRGTTGLPNSAFRYVAIAPDDPNFVVTANATTGVAMSSDGGNTWTTMGQVRSVAGVTPTAITKIAVSPKVSSGARYIVVTGIAGAGVGQIWYYNYGVGVGVWKEAFADFNLTVGNPPAAQNSTLDFQFSPNFASDLMAVALTTVSAGTGNISMQMLNFNLLGTLNSEAGFPIVILPTTGGAMVVQAASIAMSPDYDGSDDSSRNIFFGLAVTDAGVQKGGVFRALNTTVTQIYGTTTLGIAINSVAYDGTNLAAGNYVDNNVVRTDGALASTATFSSARALKRIGIDAPAFNDRVKLLYAGETLYGSKMGVTSALSKSIDNGNVWNDFALMDSALTTSNDIYPGATGNPWYIAATDANAASIYQIANGALTRVLCVPVTAPAQMLRIDGIASDSNVIYATDTEATASAIYFTDNGGQTRWFARTNLPTASIADVAVESATTMYLGQGGTTNIYKSTNKAFSWSSAIDTKLGAGNSIYDMESLGEGKLLIGGTFGGVCFSTDGGTSFTQTLGVLGGGFPFPPVAVAASGLTPSDWIFAAPTNSKTIWRAPAAFLGEFKSMGLTGNVAQAFNETTKGIALINGVLYTTSDNGTAGSALNYINSTLDPTTSKPLHTDNMWRTQASFQQLNLFGGPTGFLANRAPDALKASTDGKVITLYAFDQNLSSVFYLMDNVALAAPAILGPADKSLVQIASPLTGAAQPVNFAWSRLSLSNAYELQISLDSTFDQLLTLPAAGIVGSVLDPVSSIQNAGGILAPLFQPGTTYYWRVRATAPFRSAWSESREFTVQPTAASVPSIASPGVGAVITGTPAFSWSPVGGATSYKFELDTGTAFTAPLYAVTATGAGVQLPPSVKLVPGKTYFWRVKSLTPVESDWSSVANFVVAEPVMTTTPTATTTPTFTVTMPPVTTQVITVPPATTTEVNPTYIWAIIIIGAILVIAVIVLIVRTRRSV